MSKSKDIASIQGMGGRARAANMTAAARSEAAKRAAVTRWRGAIPRATHDGRITLKDANAQIECAVLDNGARVISERAFSRALGAKRGGSHWQRMKEVEAGARLPVFLSANRLKPFISLDLANELANPIHYLTEQGAIGNGVRAEIIPKILNVWLTARDAGVLRGRSLLLAARADILMRGLAEVGIIAMVDEATGYQDARARDALATILEAFVAKEVRQWVKTFPPEYYKQLYRLRGLPFPPENNRMPPYFGHLTNDIVYARLAPGVLDDLRSKNPVQGSGARQHKHHQLLTESIGHPKLKEHLASVITLMRLAPDSGYDDFHEMLDRAIPKPISAPLFEQAFSGSGA